MNDIYEICGSFTFTNGLGDTLLFNLKGTEKEIKNLIQEYLPENQFIGNEDEIDEVLFELIESMENGNYDDLVIYKISKNKKQLFKLDENLSSFIPDSTIKNLIGVKDLNAFLNLNKTYICSFNNNYLEELSIEEIKDNLDIMDDEISDEEVLDDWYSDFYSDFSILKED